MFGNVLPVFDMLVADPLLDIRCRGTQPGNPVDHVRHQVKTIQVIEYRHVKGRGGRALFLVATHVQVVVTESTIGQPVNQPGIAVIGKDDRRVAGEECVDVFIRPSVRVFTSGDS